MEPYSDRGVGEPLSSILSSFEDAWVALLVCVPLEDVRLVCGPLVRAMASLGKDFELVKYSILREVIDTSDEVQLFRGSGIYTTIIAYSTVLHGSSWLHGVLLPVLRKHIYNSGLSFEVDPIRAGNKSAAVENARNLLQVANHLLAALLSSSESMPVYVVLSIFDQNADTGVRPLRRTYAFAQQQAASKFPTHMQRVAPSLFFLRLLCPALVSPEEYGLVDSRPSERISRALVLLAKLLQSVANEVPPFGKEAYMEVLNDWVKGAIPSVRRFFKLSLVRFFFCVRR